MIPLNPGPRDDYEEWKIIPGFEGRYEISSHGNVRTSNYRRTKKEKFLKCYFDQHGYCRVDFYLKGKRFPKNVHVLVAQEFIGDRPSGYDINHNDGMKGNSHFSNLEYVTRGENIKHAYKNGLMKARDMRGSKHPFSKLTEDKVLQIISYLKSGMTQTKIASLMGIDQTTVSLIKLGKSWPHVTGWDREHPQL